MHTPSDEHAIIEASGLQGLIGRLREADRISADDVEGLYGASDLELEESVRKAQSYLGTTTAGRAL